MHLLLLHIHRQAHTGTHQTMMMSRVRGGPPAFVWILSGVTATRFHTYYTCSVLCVYTYLRPTEDHLKMLCTRGPSRFIYDICARERERPRVCIYIYFHIHICICTQHRSAQSSYNYRHLLAAYCIHADHVTVVVVAVAALCTYKQTSEPYNFIHTPYPEQYSTQQNRPAIKPFILCTHIYTHTNNWRL